MCRTCLLSLFALLLVANSACTYAWPTRPPATQAAPGPAATVPPTLTPSEEATESEGTLAGGPAPLLPASVEPCTTTERLTTTQHLLDLVTSREMLTGTMVSESSLFPVQKVEFYPDGSLSTFVMERTFSEEPPGTARLALARAVPDSSQPELPAEMTTAQWVLLAPSGEGANVIEWHDIQIELPCGSEPTSLVIERPIAEVLPFARGTDPVASLQAVEEARKQWTDPTGAGWKLWVDMLLLEQIDGQGAKSWELYAFAKLPGQPGGEDRMTRFCCRWLGCGRATGTRAKVCRYWGCRKWMCP